MSADTSVVRTRFQFTPGHDRRLALQPREIEIDVAVNATIVRIGGHSVRNPYCDVGKITQGTRSYVEQYTTSFHLICVSTGVEVRVEDEGRTLPCGSGPQNSVGARAASAICLPASRRRRRFVVT